MTTSLKRDLLPLKGKTFLITGVSRRQGIGYAIARQAAAWGASIIAHHFQTHDESQDWGADHLQAVLDGIKAELTKEAFLYDVSADFSEPEAPQALVDTVTEACGRIDGIVCNHALSGSDGALGKLTAAMLDAHYAINTRATLLLAQAFANQHQPEFPGRVIFMTSGQGLGPMTGEVAYSASKGALAQITHTISDQLADQNITVNTVNPGPVDTGYMTEQLWKDVHSKFPFGRFGQQEDPARLIAWLLSEEASWITGQIIHSEGGFRRH